jgi:hypothetical protein
LAVISFTRKLRSIPNWVQPTRRTEGVPPSEASPAIIKDFQKSLEDYQAAAVLNAKSVTARSGVARVLFELRHYEKAQVEYEIVTALDPQNVVGARVLAWLLVSSRDAKKRDETRGITLAKKACELTSWKDPVCLETLGEVCWYTGHMKDAAKWQKKALEFPAYRNEHGARGQELLLVYEHQGILSYREDPHAMPAP